MNKPLIKILTLLLLVFDLIGVIKSSVLIDSDLHNKISNRHRGLKQLKTSSSIVRYEPNWDSLDKRPLPEWYDKAKIGIFIHWGVYSVPSFGSEWFWMNWRGTKEPTYIRYMTNNFKPNFTYQNFASDFTAEHFDANEWANIFVESGAKYIVFTSKHHDGYAMWPSKYSFSWNSMDVGPHRDIIGELMDAIKHKTDLKFGLYHSLYEWFNPMYLNDKLNIFQQNEFVMKKVYPEMIELVNRYHPEIFWSDGEWEAPYQYWNSTNFLAWLYNDSPVKDTVVTNDRWGMEILCKHGDFYTCSDRYNPGVLQKHKWENAMTIDKKSWGHRANAKLEDFLTSKELITELVTTVSCGGNININVGPTKSGIIESIFVERLYDMGRWLQINGEAIYSSVPWKFQNDTVTAGVWYTCNLAENSIKNLRRQIVYAIILNYPYNTSGIQLHSMAGLFDNQTNVYLLGYSTQTSLQWHGSTESMYVTFPDKGQIDQLDLTLAWTLKIDIPIIN